MHTDAQSLGRNDDMCVTHRRQSMLITPRSSSYRLKFNFRNTCPRPRFVAVTIHLFHISILCFFSSSGAHSYGLSERVKKACVPLFILFRAGDTQAHSVH